MSLLEPSLSLHESGMLVSRVIVSEVRVGRGSLSGGRGGGGGSGGRLCRGGGCG